MSEAVAEPAAPRVESVAAAIDRFFPVGWIAFYLLLPTSGWAPVMFRSWADQRRDLGALRSVIETGHSDVISSNGIGPAYIGAARLVHAVIGLSPQDSLVFLNRASYALGVAAGMLLVGILVRRLVDAPPVVSIATQFLFGALLFAAGTWHWSDVPWSHFFAAFLAVALYALRFVPKRLRAGHAVAVGAVLALLALTRSFELTAVLLAWAIAAVALLVLDRASLRPRWSLVAWGAGAVAATTAVVYAGTGKRGFFFLYGNALDQQSGNVAPTEVAHTPTFSFAYVPTKLVQLFVEPCYRALCSLADYAGGAAPLPSDLVGAAGNEKLWRLPLFVQLPSLVLLPVCVVAVVAGLAWYALHRTALSARVRELRAIFEMTVAATGLVVGYAASTMTGSPHLRYGFARDFLLPALLTAVVAVALAGGGAWVALRRRAWGGSAFIVGAMLASALLVGTTAYARAHGIPRIESRQLSRVEYHAACASTRCRVSVTAEDRAGRVVAIPPSSTLTFGCGSDTPRFTLYVTTLSRAVELDRSCASPLLVSAWPTVMGLPPGSYELGFVDVSNA